MGNGRRGRMINASDRRQAVELIKETVDSGVALCKACAELGISKRTYNRWKNTDSDYIDKRTICARPEPANKLTMEEKEKILDVCNSEEFASKTPSEIVPILADRGSYIASESTFYKVLKEAKQLLIEDGGNGNIGDQYQPTRQREPIRFGCGISHT